MNIVAAVLIVFLIAMTYLITLEMKLQFLKKQEEYKREFNQKHEVQDLSLLQADLAEIHHDLSSLEREFTEYKKRTDSIALKVGFKL